MKKELFIYDLKKLVNERITETFFLKSITEVVKEKAYYRVVLADKTGEINCFIWQEFIDPVYLKFEKMFVLVEGRVSEYEGRTQILIEKMAPMKEYVLEDFCPVAENIDGLKQELLTFIKKVKKPHFNALLKNIFHNEAFFNAFSKKQAGSMVHHVYIGGLLEHTLNVTNICINTVKLYQKRNPNYFHEGFDIDLLVTAALLHDIGKVKEYASFPINKKTTGGRLVGHLNYGVGMVYTAIRELDIEFPNADIDKLLHCLVTHHGVIDGIIPPMITEAVILCRADEMDARIDAFESAIAKDTSHDEFTNYNRLMDLYVYKN